MKIEIEYFNPVLIIVYKGFPINRFVPEVYTSKGDIFDPYFICHEDNIHCAYEKGFEKLKEAYEAEGRAIDEYYSKTLREYTDRNPIPVKVDKKPKSATPFLFPNHTYVKNE